MRDAVEQPWQVTQHGRDTAGDTINGADVLKIGRKLSLIMASLVEQFLRILAARQESGVASRNSDMSRGGEEQRGREGTSSVLRFPFNSWVQRSLLCPCHPTTLTPRHHR